MGLLVPIIQCIIVEKCGEVNIISDALLLNFIILESLVPIVMCFGIFYYE